jgi:hypothetical protein
LDDPVGITAAHGDHHVGGPDRLIGPALWCAIADIDSSLGHNGNRDRVDRRGRLLASRVDLDSIAGKGAHEAGCHL